MRILASNPDTIGDVLLRQPLYRALQDDGHQLALIARPLLNPLLSLIAPGAHIIPFEANLYDPRLAPDSADLDAIAEAARAFDPEVLLVAPFQWTVLEERLAAVLPSARSIALSGRRFVDPEFGPAPPPIFRPAVRVEVAEDVAETRKNELLAGAVLGRAVSLPDPALTASPAMLRAGEAELARLGLQPGQFWAVCIGDTQHTRVRNWHPKRWSAALSSWAKQGKRFLLVGHSSETETSRAIIAAMGDHAPAAAVWSGEGQGDLDTLLGLLAHSQGYIGRDTGPMHLAAALGKPVLAVFGGGTWPRFLPATTRSIALAVGVPCVGCGWHCELPESYCIKEVPLAEVLRAMDDLEAGRADRTVRLLDPGAPLLAKIGREAAAASRERRLKLSVVRREHMDQSEALTGVLERSVKRAGEADRLAQELDTLKAEMNRRESILRKRLAAAENLWKAREADLMRRLQELDALEARYGGLAQLREELVTARAAGEDAALREARLRADQQALTALCNQQDDEIALLRQRLRDLVASRWRRYGQRLHMCMTLPWEHEVVGGNGNGRG